MRTACFYSRQTRQGHWLAQITPEEVYTTPHEISDKQTILTLCQTKHARNVLSDSKLTYWESICDEIHVFLLLLQAEKSKERKSHYWVLKMTLKPRKLDFDIEKSIEIANAKYEQFLVICLDILLRNDTKSCHQIVKSFLSLSINVFFSRISSKSRILTKFIFCSFVGCRKFPKFCLKCAVRIHSKQTRGSVRFFLIRREYSLISDKTMQSMVRGHRSNRSEWEQWV